MKTLLITFLLSFSAGLFAADAPKTFRGTAETVQKILDDPKSTPEDIKYAQKHAIEALQRAANIIESYEKNIEVQTAMLKSARNRIDMIEGKWAVKKEGKENEYVELVVRSGKTYKNVKVISSDENGIKFSHDEGVSTASILDLPEEMALKYIK